MPAGAVASVPAAPPCGQAPSPLAGTVASQAPARRRRHRLVGGASVRWQAQSRGWRHRVVFQVCAGGLVSGLSRSTSPRRMLAVSRACHLSGIGTAWKWEARAYESPHDWAVGSQGPRCCQRLPVPAQHRGCGRGSGAPTAAGRSRDSGGGGRGPGLRRWPPGSGFHRSASPSLARGLRPTRSGLRCRLTTSTPAPGPARGPRPTRSGLRSRLHDQDAGAAPARTATPRTATLR